MERAGDAGMSAWDRLRKLVGNPAEWNAVTRLTVIHGIAVPIIVFFILRGQFLLEHPEVEPYLSREFLPGVMVVLGLFVAAGFAVIWMGHYVERDGRAARWLVYLGTQLWFVMWAAATYCHGPVTTPFWTIFPFLGMGTLLLWDTRVMVAGIVTGLAILYGTGIAERAGVLPYAPMFSAPPLIEGRVADGWWLSSMVWPAVVSLCVFAAFRYILMRFHESAAQVARMSEVLKQMFGRYMSTEVLNALLDDPEALKMGGDRCKVTILMTDLRGFTPIAERLPPENVLVLLNDYFRVMIDVVLKHHGTINQIVGDALVVTFGAPQEMEHHAASAVACAIEMQNAMNLVNEGNMLAGQPEMHMGIGLNTAVVVVGNIGSEKRSSYGVVGSGVNIASRIESYATGGQVLASQSVIDEVRHWISVNGHRQVTPKGVETPVDIYEIGGIAGPFSVALDRADQELTPVPRELYIDYEVVLGKHVFGSSGAARVLSFSRTELVTERIRGLKPFDDIRIVLRAGSPQLRRMWVYAKTVEMDPDGKSPTRMRFTSVPPEVLGYLEGLIDS